MKCSEVFSKAKEEHKKVFVAYVTAGDPSMSHTHKVVQKLADAGADIVELGVPFTDPVADGPTNIQAAERGIASGTTLSTMLKHLAEQPVALPVVIFTYYNPIFKLGHDAFARAASEAGVAGVLVVDLPPEEAGGYKRVMDEHGIETVFLASPTTDPIRLKEIDRLSNGFIYYVSRAGVTGVRNDISGSLAQEVSSIKMKVTHPIAIGFGISTPEQAKEVAQYAEGVVVGSALVNILAEYGDADQGLDKIFQLVFEMKSQMGGT